MKLQKNPRLDNFTKSAITIGILVPRVPLHYRCLPNTLVVPFLTLTLQRGTVIRHIERPKLVFPPFLRNGTNLHPSNSRKRATFATSTHVSLVETPTHYRKSTRKTIPHHPRQFEHSRSLRFRMKPNKRENIDDLAKQKTADDHDSCTMRKHARATSKAAVDRVASHARTSSQ